MKDGATSEVDWIERYESLRAHALGQAPLGFVPLDLALVLRRGLAAWMAVDRGASDPRRSSDLESGREEQGTEATLDTSRTELVRVLAGMALIGRRRGAA